MTEFPSDSAFERGKHKFTPIEDGPAGEIDRGLRLSRAEYRLARARRVLDDLLADLGEVEHAVEDEKVGDMLSGIRRVVAEIIDDLN